MSPAGRLVVFALVLLSSSCSPLIYHEPGKAADEANQILRILYFEKDFEKTFRRLDVQVQNQYRLEILRDLVDRLLVEYGELNELRLDSFSPVPGQRAIILFYVGTQQRAQSYHQVVLRGDSNGYKVAEIHVSRQPDSVGGLRQPWPSKVVVRPDDIHGRRL